MDECLRVLKKATKVGSTATDSIRNSVLIISHITFRDCRANIFSGNLSRNSCIKKSVIPTKMEFSRAFFRQSFSQDPASINYKKKNSLSL